MNSSQKFCTGFERCAGIREGFLNPVSFMIALSWILAFLYANP